MAAPLAGILVVALEQALAAPYATMRLAEAGARVIKVERPEGDFARHYDRAAAGESAYFVWANRGKESVVLDIKDAADAAFLHRLIARADVFVQNLAPGAAARAGFDSAVLRKRHPPLVTCDISGYGEEGPYAGMKAYDLLVQAEAGILAVTGTPKEPCKVGISITDIGTGLSAHAAILEALLARSAGGKGTGISISMFDCMAEWMTVPYLYEAYGGGAPPRTGARHNLIAPYGPFRARDGQILLAIQNDREWRSFCVTALEQPELAGLPEFRDNPSRVANQEKLAAAINEVFSALTVEQVIGRLEAARVAYGRLNSMADLARHPQLRLEPVITPTASLRLPALPGVLRPGSLRPGSGQALPPGESPRRVPALGEHSAAIRAEFGV